MSSDRPPVRDESAESDDSSTDPFECPECGGRIHRSDLEWVCRACDTVVEADPIDHGPEWRSFESDGDERTPTRVGPARTETMHDHGLGTRIDWRDVDGYGNQLGPAKQRQLRRLRQFDRRSEAPTSVDQNRREAFTEIARIVGVLELPDSVHERACRLARRAQEENLYGGRSLEGMATAAVYGACREQGLTRGVDEIATVARTDTTEILNCYTVLNVSLGLRAAILTPSAWVPPVLSELADEWPGAISDELRKRALDYARVVEAHEKRFSGAAARSLAATVVYLAIQRGDREAGPWGTQRAVAAAADRSTATIRSHLEDVEALLGEADSDARLVQ